MSKCVICKNKIGFFAKYFTVDTGEKVCKNCLSNSEPEILIENLSSAADVAFHMDNSVGDTYAEEKEEEFDFDEDWDVEKEIQQEENETDFTKNLRIKSGKKEYGFNIQLFDNNIQ
ncbi:hypothetical protein NDQ39_04360 [Lactiplantibacillus plantarum]|uniref:hypothetical protein n=1 Tax=Lactiplantibacillus plantarum TaxID=1590 RepID=UPI00203A771D|nr:hypothetical protein [Lactiplantibacillus plantarum]MCM2643007.1 hypothetical protein [Lactiplantibacillus plantarum]